jgi:hypothetical protein
MFSSGAVLAPDSELMRGLPHTTAVALASCAIAQALPLSGDKWGVTAVLSPAGMRHQANCCLVYRLLPAACSLPSLGAPALGVSYGTVQLVPCLVNDAWNHSSERPQYRKTSNSYGWWPLGCIPKSTHPRLPQPLYTLDMPASSDPMCAVMPSDIHTLIRSQGTTLHVRSARLVGWYCQ